MSNIQQYLIIILLHATSAEGEKDLSLRSNPGLHAFTYHGSFADDISFGKLIMTVNTKQIVRAVQKTSATMPDRISNRCNFRKMVWIVSGVFSCFFFLRQTYLILTKLFYCGNLRSFGGNYAFFCCGNLSNFGGNYAFFTVGTYVILAEIMPFFTVETYVILAENMSFFIRIFPIKG